MNYKIRSGPFAGQVTDGRTILDVPYASLGDALRERIYEFAEDKYSIEDLEDYPITMDELKKEYEQSWEREETTEETTMFSTSEMLQFYSPQSHS